MTNRKTLAAAGGFSVAGIAAAIALIGPHEGLRLDPYRDVIGKRTVCYGETAVPMRRYSKAECDAILAKSIRKHGNDGIAKCLPAVLPFEMQGAFLSIGYNIGVDGFCRSSMSRKALAGDYRGACRAISLYVYAGGKDCRIAANRCSGIPKRRADEQRLCEAGLG